MEINVEKLEVYRSIHGENKYDFARRLGLSHTWYYNMLKSHRKPTFTTIEKIALALNVKPKDLIK